MPDGEEGNGGHGFFWFVIGILIGIAATVFVPGWAAPYLPNFLGGGTGIEGEVLEKVSEPDRILVKVTTADGLILVTFTQNLKELDLLIGQGDRVTLDLDGYEPLAENPEVARVIGSTASGEPERQIEPLENETKTGEDSEPAETEEMKSTEDSENDEAQPIEEPGASEDESPASENDASTETQDDVP